MVFEGGLPQVPRPNPAPFRVMFGSVGWYGRNFASKGFPTKKAATFGKCWSQATPFSPVCWHIEEN